MSKKKTPAPAADVPVAPPRKKTPSERVIAAKWLLQKLERDATVDELVEGLTELVDSRVNAAKVEKVLKQFDKIAGRFIARLEAIVSKFEGNGEK